VRTRAPVRKGHDRSHTDTYTHTHNIVRRQWRTYREATAAASAAAAAAAATATASDAPGDAGAGGAGSKPAAEDDVVLPLAPGVLVANLGLPVVLLCLKVRALWERSAHHAR
jgi:hypothetical protein